MLDNESALGLIRYHSFYDLYWLLATKIFLGYGQNSLRAEAEMSKLLLIPLLYKDGLITHDNECTGIYQFGKKKLYIVLNKMSREDYNQNPKCIATGHDRHVKKFAAYFNPYRGFADTFTKILCQVADDWILWNFNEFVGEIQQCLSSSQGSKQRSSHWLFLVIYYKNVQTTIAW